MRIAFLRSARADLEDISHYISNDSPAAARRVIDRIRLAVRRLAAFPRSARVGSEPGTRELVVTGLPYVVVYRIVGEQPHEFVEIVGVFHAARDLGLRPID
jgi:addiction module RelE/StbE family toxin